jgi:hypothetical protein|tara:strand:+ start:7786 stop:8391 length:606 start_codon:yes stop_codon:yes gene_type:complete
MSEVQIYEKDVEEYHSQVSLVEERANQLVISSKEEMTTASDLLIDLKKIEKIIIARKKKITRPLMDALASARDLFKPLEIGYSSAKNTINSKMLDYTDTEDTRIEKEKDRVEKRVAKGTMRVDTAVKKLEEAGEIKTSFDGAKSKTIFQKRTKIRVVDVTLIPREFMLPDLVTLHEVVVKKKIPVPGVETYEEKSIVSRTR